MPKVTSTTPSSIIQAFGGRIKAQTVTMPIMIRINPISAASLHFQKGFLFLLL